MIAFSRGVHVDGDGNVWVTDASEAEGKGHRVFRHGLTQVPVAVLVKPPPDEVERQFWMRLQADWDLQQAVTRATKAS